jgi:hypothetical protein
VSVFVPGRETIKIQGKQSIQVVNCGYRGNRHFLFLFSFPFSSFSQGFPSSLLGLEDVVSRGEKKMSLVLKKAMMNFRCFSRRAAGREIDELTQAMVPR